MSPRAVDRAGKQETVLIGHDWGAVIAWYFATRKVRPLTHLIICNVPHPEAMLRGMTFKQILMLWYMLFFQLPWLPEALIGRQGGARLKDLMQASAIDKRNFPDEVGEVYRRNAMQPGALNAMLNYYRALLVGGGSWRQRSLGFPIIETPTLMVWGEEDEALTKETTFATSDFVRDLTLRYLPGVSHWVQQEQPEVVNAMISAFLNSEPVPEYTPGAALS